MSLSSFKSDCSKGSGHWGGKKKRKGKTNRKLKKNTNKRRTSKKGKKKDNAVDTTRILLAPKRWTTPSPRSDDIKFIIFYRKYKI